MWRVLIVGGDGARATALSRGLREKGYGVVHARSAALGARLAPDADLAIVALDRGRDDGTEVAALFERFERRVPVMVVPERGPAPPVAARCEPIARCEFDDVEADFLRYRATKSGVELDLSPREFEILRFLAERRGRVVSREELLRGVWGSSGASLTRTVDVHIAKLRKKIGDPPHAPKYIVTVHRAGYRFVA